MTWKELYAARTRATFQVAAALQDCAQALAKKPLSNYEDPPEPEPDPVDAERARRLGAYFDWVDGQDLDLRDAMFLRAARDALERGETEIDDENPEDILDEFGVPENARP